MTRLPIPTGPPPIQLDRTRVAYSNQFVTVYDDDVRFVDGPGTYLRIVEGSGEPGVACLATCADHLALVLVYRYPIGRWEWAIPRGFASSTDPTESILAEVREELGERPTEISRLGTVTANSGLLAGEVVIYHGRWDVPPNEPIDRREVHSIAWLTLAELRGEISSGTVNDGVTLAAVTLAQAHGIL